MALDPQFDVTSPLGFDFQERLARAVITVNGTDGQYPRSLARLVRNTPQPVSVRSFGAKGDGVTDDTAAFQRAINSVVAAPIDNAAGAHGTPAGIGSLTGRLGMLLIPRGQYLITSTLHLNRVMVLQGEGGLGWYPATQLIFPDNVPGIVVDYYASSSDGGRGDWSVIRDIGLFAKGHSSTSAHGIAGNARFTLENFGIWNFGGDGIHIDAGAPVSNCNNWYEKKGTIYYCHNGMFVQGNDSNAGHAEDVDCSFNDRWGVFDKSFLGNTYIAMHTSSNNQAPGGASGGPYSMGYTYDSDGTNTGGNLSASTLIGCYTEGGGGTSRYDQYVLNLRPVGDDTVLSSGKGSTLIADNQGLRSNQALKVVNAVASKNTTSVLGSGAAYASSAHRALSVSTDDANSEYDLDWEDSSATGWWALARGGAASKVAWAVSGGTASVGDGQLAVPNGVYIGGYTGTKVKAFLSGTKTFDFPSVVDGAMTSTTVTVTGAVLGDVAHPSLTVAVPAGAILAASVTAADTVTVTLFNKTGAPLDLASATLRADVWQH